ncbi:hypothetical protein SAMN02745823_02499 [Sporobacter termitidis DSM 10068]|uniref:Uncharacterized protein n=1 Tax=Sporobacter termitidis DSM 10068 TaxID=1123282 RepID=A0A1M5YHM6_9FIRM|nr:hypothetical protein [Sporobacter termitidis]SHI11003.1 hypothetical protein SAMN02745823_02499 [Sporobacter termitidis DSM 10068]
MFCYGLLGVSSFINHHRVCGYCHISYRSESVGSYGYTFYSQVGTSPDANGCDVSASTTVVSNTNVPTGYMGAQAYLYDASDGSLWFSSGWAYNGSLRNTVFATHSTYVINGNGWYWFGNGDVQLWNGYSYVLYPTYNTPNIESATSKTSKVESNNSAAAYGINNNNQTFGSTAKAQSINTAPDLIYARGIDGTYGYVYKTDIYNAGRISSPEEAMNASVPQTISLYASDGTTVIGSFGIGA